MITPMIIPLNRPGLQALGISPGSLSRSEVC